jgi:hypothetical protein
MSRVDKRLTDKIKRRDPIARDLLTPKYRLRVERNRKIEARNNPPRAISQ